MARQNSLWRPPQNWTPSISGDLYVQWPDGRVWFDTLGYSYYRRAYSSWQYALAVLLRPEPKSCGPRQLMAGSNWVSVTTKHIDYWNPNGNHERIRGYLDTVGVKRDGTLWISRAAKPPVWNAADMMPVERETNWQQVAWWQNGVVLLKTGGTLWWWSWGTNHFDSVSWQTNWPTVRNHPWLQIGTNTDWQELAGNRWSDCYARKTDGSTWFLSDSAGRLVPDLARQTNLDQVVLQTLSQSGRGHRAYIASDGTLRVSIQSGNGVYPGYEPVGVDTNWLAVRLAYNWLVALKRDGTLWKWNLPGNDEIESSWFFIQKPVRLGIHNDWVGLGDMWSSVVSLAADGSLWAWPATEAYEFALMKPPKQPRFLGNIYGAIPTPGG